MRRHCEGVQGWTRPQPIVWDILSVLSVYLSLSLLFFFSFKHLAALGLSGSLQDP